MSGRSWAIVGGGILGAGLALKLAQAGEHVSVFERAPGLGGLASAWELGDVRWDRHYHVTLLSDEATRRLLAELGVEEEMRWVVTRTGCYAGGKLYSVSNALEFLRYPPLHLVDRLRLGGTIWYAARIDDWKRLEEVGVEEWLTRFSGHRTFNEFWRPLLRSKLGDNYRYASAAFIWAVIQRLYAARRSGLKKEMFGYLPGGYARILSLLAARLEETGVDLRLGEAVEGVGSRGGAFVRHAGVEEQFDEVVVTVAAPVAARLVEGLSAAEREALNGVRYQGIVCASLLLDRALSPFYVTNITDPGLPFTGIIEMTALVDPAEFGGRHLVYLPCYVPTEDELLDASDESVCQLLLSGLRRLYPDLGEEHVLAVRVSRERYVLPIPTVGYSRRLPSQETGLRGVHIINSAHIVNGTLNVNETVRLAERAARRLLGGSEQAM